MTNAGPNKARNGLAGHVIKLFTVVYTKNCCIY